MLTCPNGHRGPMRGPLLLFDPVSPIAIYSSGDDKDPADARAQGDYLMGTFWQSLPPDEKRAGLIIELAPPEILPNVLDNPRVNLGDLAPGSPESDEALQICSDIRSGRASAGLLRTWLGNTSLHSALRAGIRFELASYLGRQESAEAIEEAILEWRRVLQLYPRSSDQRRWAIACLELGQCYAVRREANAAANAREAMHLLNAALEVLTADRYPEDFAWAHSRKANLLLDMGSTTVLVEQSLSAFQSALTVFTRESYPEDWALLLSNMATAYLMRGGYTGLDDLRAAVALMEQALAIRTREAQPYAWAITQMNLGLALSSLPASEGAETFIRGVAALRGAYEVFRDLGDLSRKFSAAYNLGLTLARSKVPSLAEESCDRLEESLPWLLETSQHKEATDALALLSKAYVTWLHSEADLETADQICRRVIATFKDHSERESAMTANFEVGVWLLGHAQSRRDRLGLARVALERVLEATRAIEYAEVRAATLANFASILLVQEGPSRELDRVRARDSLEEALRILRSLPVTPEREKQVGLIVMNRVRSGLGSGFTVPEN